MLRFRVPNLCPNVSKRWGTPRHESLLNKRDKCLTLLPFFPFLLPMSPAGSNLQNQCDLTASGRVGSIPIHSRHHTSWDTACAKSRRPCAYACERGVLTYLFA